MYVKENSSWLPTREKNKIKIMMPMSVHFGNQFGNNIWDKQYNRGTIV